MENENEVEVETQETPEVAEGQEDTTDWRAKALESEARIKELEFKASKQREKTKELKKLASQETSPPESKPTDLTDGQKALFVAYGVKSKAEIALGKELMDRLQINSVEALVEDDYFQTRLTKLRNEIAAKDAVPVSTGRSASTQGNKLDYWLAKYQTSGNLGEVPKELQRDVLNARLKAEEQKTKFG